MKGAGTPAEASRAQLEALAAEYRHVHQEHRRAHADGTTRRHLENRLHELEQRLDQLLDEWVPDEDVQAAWRAHLRGGAPPPPSPTAAGVLVFRGAAETGSQVEIRERPNGDYEVAIDGTLVERVVTKADVSHTEPPHPFRLDELVFQETFSASQPALEALAAFVAERVPQPPWRFAVELRADGLIDGHFGLTPRGHRALAQVR